MRSIRSCARGSQNRFASTRAVGADPLTKRQIIGSKTNFGPERVVLGAMEHDLAGKKVHVDDVLQVFKSRDLKSDVLSQPGKDTVIQLGVVSDVDGREWIEATLPDGTFGFVLGPSVRSQANSPAESLAGSAQVSGEVDFVCPKCNVPQSKTGWADLRCSANHKLMHNATSLRYRAGHEGGAFCWGGFFFAGVGVAAGVLVWIFGVYRVWR